MKNPWEWVQADLEQLIAEKVQESLYLDYKDGRALDPSPQRTDNITKDVSSFANSDGGTLVYGMIEDKRYPVDLAGCDAKAMSKEALDQIIGRVQPRFTGYRIAQIELTGEHQGRIVYVVSVERATKAHQAIDKRYYKRFEYRGEPMEDYEIRDVNNRQGGPDLELLLPWQPGSAVHAEFGEDTAYSEPTTLTPRIVNRSAEPAFFAAVTIHVDAQLKAKCQGVFPEEKAANIFLPGQSLVATRAYTMQWIAPPRMPVFLNYEQPVFDDPIRIQVPREGVVGYIAWELQAPHMARVRRTRKLVFNGIPSVYQAITLPMEEADIEWLDESYYVGL